MCSALRLLYLACALWQCVGGQTAAQGSHAFFLDFSGIQQKAMLEGNHYRKGDILISVPAKSGTTWSMNIVHQLRSAGDPDLRDIYQQVPWLELWDSPSRTLQQVLERYAALPTWFPRAFKTHAAIGQEFLEYSPDRKFLVVMRNPFDAAASMVPFFNAINQELLDFWGASGKIPRPKNISDAWSSNFTNQGNKSIGFIKSFWPYRHQPNVIVLHYNDMIKDHRGTVRKIADFLEIDLPTSQFEDVLKYTSFPWMKANSHRFSMQHLMDKPLMSSSASVRNGKSGEGSAVPADVKAAFEEKMRDELLPEQAIWLMSGGEEHLAIDSTAKEL